MRCSHSPVADRIVSGLILVAIFYRFEIIFFKLITAELGLDHFFIIFFFFSDLRILKFKFDFVCKFFLKMKPANNNIL